MLVEGVGLGALESSSSTSVPFSLLLFAKGELKFLGLWKSVSSAVNWYAGAVNQWVGSSGRGSALGKQALRLALKAHAYAGL